MKTVRVSRCTEKTNPINPIFNHYLFNAPLLAYFAIKAACLMKTIKEPAKSRPFYIKSEINQKL
ncbi:hypothetical protein DC20_08585 [Rufibacter tibetensis]|uniref:Uncharacterized protein n=1 Tax=Rufibacter tibetensis TaxID=512763 RepID=A0A0P0CP59_9BACT|nr:hypothetical protein DC20_08585 [Rufibacter tibetensis]